MFSFLIDNSDSNSYALRRRESVVDSSIVFVSLSLSKFLMFCCICFLRFDKSILNAMYDEPEASPRRSVDVDITVDIRSTIQLFYLM